MASHRDLVDEVTKHLADDGKIVESGWAAWEPVIVAMKPLDGTFAQNALKHGVAGVNVDGCRLPTSDNWAHGTSMGRRSGGIMGKKVERGPCESNPAGRWPANVVLDEDAAQVLDASVEPSKGDPRGHGHGHGGIWSGSSGSPVGPLYRDGGSPSRFFYTAKVSPDERGSCSHPTMKPLDLMRWLLTLVTMPSGTRVLDPFAGSGSTLVAARQLGIEAVGIEMSPEYAEFAEVRVASAKRWVYEQPGPRTATDDGPSLFSEAV